jgi:hypothetical protein
LQEGTGTKTGAGHPKLRIGSRLSPAIPRNPQLWLLGLVTSYTMGGFIHILLVLAVVVLVIRLVQGRSVV